MNRMFVLAAMIAAPYLISTASVPDKSHRAAIAGKIINNMRTGKDLKAWLKRPAPPYKFRSKLEMQKYVKLIARNTGLDPKLMLRIVAVESANCKYRVNTLTNDFGCMQLNATTIQLYGWNKQSVTHNDFLNVYAAAIILKDFKRANASDPDWVCRYNIGYQSLPATCQAYIFKLASVQL